MQSNSEASLWDCILNKELIFAQVLKEAIMSKKRNPGAQPGNKNALDHGSYSRAISPDIEWELLNPNTDSLESEINATRDLMSRLAAAEEKPDPDLKDPDAPYKMILLATHRLDKVRAIDAELQDPLPVIARDMRDLRSHSQQTSDLYTIQNLDQAANLMLGEKYLPLAEYLPPDLLEKYEYVLAQQHRLNEVELEENDLEEDNLEQSDEI